MTIRKPFREEDPEEPIDFSSGDEAARKPGIDWEAFKVEIEGISWAKMEAFDEADALFGKGTNVQDSHDKFANLEVALEQEPLEIERFTTVDADNDDLDDPDDFDLG